MQAYIQKGMVTSEELKILLAQKDTKQFILVDVREEGEYAMSHIKGVDALKPMSSVNEWAMNLLEEHKDKAIIFTCHTGSRSGDIQNMFKKKGHEAALNHVGGIASYRGELN